MIIVIYTLTYIMKTKKPKLNCHSEYVLCSVPRLLYRCVCEYLLQNIIHVSEVHCGSAVIFGQALPGFLQALYHDYCTPLVCISDVIGLLTVWRHNKPKTKNQNHEFSLAM